MPLTSRRSAGSNKLFVVANPMRLLPRSDSPCTEDYAHTKRNRVDLLFHVVLKTFTKSVTVAERGSAHPQQIAVASSRCQMRVRELLFTVRFLQPRTCLHFVIRSCARGFKETADSLTVLPRPTLLTNGVRTFSEQSTAFDFPIS